MSKCRMDLNSLADYLDKKMGESDSARIETHLAAGCESCASQIQWINRVSSAFIFGDVSHAPVLQIDKAVSIFRDLYTKPVQINWLAQLVYDSLSSLQPIMARGERSASRHRLYQTENFEIDLWEDPISQQESYLIGQVIPVNGSDPIHWDSVQLFCRDGNEISLVQEGSEFHASAVPSGNYRLSIMISGNILKVENLALGA